MKEFKFKINGVDYTASVEEIENGKANVTVNGQTYQVETEKKAVAPKAAPKAAPAAAPAAPKAAPAAAPAAAPVAPKAAPVAGGVQVKSPLPGSVIKVVAKEGTAVKKGDTLLLLESMKMENPILAEQDGTVAQVAVAEGQSVMQDDLLVVLA